MGVCVWVQADVVDYRNLQHVGLIDGAGHLLVRARLRGHRRVRLVVSKGIVMVVVVVAGRTGHWRTVTT